LWILVRTLKITDFQQNPALKIGILSGREKSAYDLEIRLYAEIGWIEIFTQDVQVWVAG